MELKQTPEALRNLAIIAHAEKNHGEPGSFKTCKMRNWLQNNLRKTIYGCPPVTDSLSIRELLHRTGDAEGYRCRGP